MVVGLSHQIFMNAIRPYIVPGLIVVILILCFISLRQCEKAKEVVAEVDNTQFRTVIDGLKADTADLRSRNRELTRRIIQDSTEHAKVISAKNKTIVRLRASSDVQRPDIQPILDSIPKMQAFVNVLDSINTELTNVNEELNASYKAQVKGLNEQIEMNGQIQAKNDEIMRLYEERIAKLMKQNRKEHRWKKVWRGAALTLGATTAVLILAK